MSDALLYSPWCVCRWSFAYVVNVRMSHIGKGPCRNDREGEIAGKPTCAQHNLPELVAGPLLTAPHC
mgnify:CR=1 FL=1